jgi:hypothetical protein
VGVASAFEDTCSLLGRQQPGQGCESVAAPAGGPDAITNAIDDLIASLQAAFDLLEQQIKEYVQTRLEETRPLLQPQTSAVPAPSQAAPADTQANQTPIQDAANALQDAIQQHVQNQIDKALTGTEPSTTNLGGSVPGCTMEQGVSENAIRTTLRCSQRQVSSNGSSSTSSVQTSSTSVSVSSTSSSDSR